MCRREPSKPRGIDGVTVEYRTARGDVRGAQVSVLDYENPTNNDWLAVNQFTVGEGEHERRPDIVLFANGLPLGLIEIENPADEKATVWTAWKQIKTYKSELTNLFASNGVLRQGPHGHPQRRPRVVQALAHNLGQDAGRPAPASAAGDDRGDVRARPIPDVGSRLRRDRGRR